MKIFIIGYFTQYAGGNCPRTLQAQKNAGLGPRFFDNVKVELYFVALATTFFVSVLTDGAEEVTTVDGAADTLSVARACATS